MLQYLQYIGYPVAFAIGYYGHPYIRKLQTQQQYLEIQKDQYNVHIQEKEQIYPDILDTYQKLKKGSHHFMETLILQESNGLAFFRIYINKQLVSYAMRKQSSETVPKEDKLQFCNLSAVFTPTSHLQGHSGVLHGGFTATLIDNLCGYLGTLSNDFTPVATGNLNMSYKKPIKTGTQYVVKLQVSKIEGRNIFIHATVEDQHEIIYAIGEVRMVSVNWNVGDWRKAYERISNAIDQSIQSDVVD